MPDLSDKVSERPADIPEDVWEAAFSVADSLNCDFSFDGQTSGDVELREAQAAIARAIMADRRTRPTASSMQGWTPAHFYKMPGNLSGDEIIEVLLDDNLIPVPGAAKSWYWSNCDIIAYRLAASPIPPEVMK